MRPTPGSIIRFAVISLSGLMLSACVAGAVVGAGAAVVGGTAKATGAIIGAGVDAVTTSDEEARAKRIKEERRCERRQRRGKSC
ncbi:MULTISPECIES: hypothetical protein [unclassified Brevundimonas]|uniref:hypothetical protein n=1 Tax=unclassified Brevundimonas TaxID=2622653 RepID=UPI0025BB2314|nr:MULTISPECIES: hypothetical protein [unclassified Brevundimonas]